VAYAQTDLANVTGAIIVLANGERVFSVTAGLRTVQYALTTGDHPQMDCGEGFPPAKILDGIWEADAEMIIEWRKD